MGFQCPHWCERAYGILQGSNVELDTLLSRRRGRQFLLGLHLGFAGGC
jgi:hypothetical protein